MYVLCVHFFHKKIGEELKTQGERDENMQLLILSKRKEPKSSFCSTICFVIWFLDAIFLSHIFSNKMCLRSYIPQSYLLKILYHHPSKNSFI